MRTRRLATMFDLRIIGLVLIAIIFVCLIAIVRRKRAQRVIPVDDPLQAMEVPELEDDPITPPAGAPQNVVSWMAFLTLWFLIFYVFVII